MLIFDIFLIFIYNIFNNAIVKAFKKNGLNFNNVKKILKLEKKNAKKNLEIL